MSSQRELEMLAESMPVEAESVSVADPIEELRFIRATMESAGSFTAIPGWGMVVIGVTAMGAAWLAAQQNTVERWLGVWFIEAAVSFCIALPAMARKARRARQELLSGPARKFSMSFAPPLFVGALMTWLLYRAGLAAAVPAMWLLLYGTAVITGGAFSVGIVPVMGVCFVTLGTLAVFMPASWTNWQMGLGFGALHVVFGSIIARKHGG